MYRLTLVNDYNIDNLKEYAELVAIGEPDFIEIKGVTFSGAGSTTTATGTNSSSSLRMSNCPFHHEVVSFCQKLCDILGNQYSIASEHEHSNCVLIAHQKFHIDGKWFTWIDYEKFQQLIRLEKPFTSLDYAKETPYWAAFGSQHRGFDPYETRHRRNKQPKESSLVASSDNPCCSGQNLSINENTSTDRITVCGSNSCYKRQNVESTPLAYMCAVENRSA